MSSSTAGQGDPYWYEWTVGLIKVVEMLESESSIQSVSFQVTGAKGWDDVSVQYADGKRDYIQVKHSRVDKSLTFGDLVTVDSDGSSLLGSLFEAWREMKLDPEKNKCVLFTNRTAGSSYGRSGKGVARPPLSDFMNWLKSTLASASSIHDCHPDTRWKDAWGEWLAQLNSGTETETLAFLKTLDVLTAQMGLPELESAVLNKLASTFQISCEKALPLFHALDHALRLWTTGQKQVNVEDVFTALSLEEDRDTEHRAPPPPAPFFPSRIEVSLTIERLLADSKGNHVLFLCAEPGGGKTSLISELTNRRRDEALQGLIGLRYFAFRPITPESPLIPPDADHFVRADRLWFSLLSQLRQGLKGKLKDYQVPLRNSLLNWMEARAAVIRIAKRLGNELNRPFIIVIDGIDHAARAMRYETSLAKEFFSSLPSPDEIGDSPIKLLVAGQPPATYPEYPEWLRIEHPKVTTVPLGRLDRDDIRTLVLDSGGVIRETQADGAVAVIEEVTGGNTLAVVFAVKEASQCSTVENLKLRLLERHLQDGLREYYKSIWRHTLASIEHAALGMENALASALCLTSERLTGSLMGSAFNGLGLSVSQWEMLLGFLGPLVVQDSDGLGFRVLHNDVRVYLHGELSGMPLHVRRQGASMLADHYMKPSSQRYFAHKSLRRLLREARRDVEWAKTFNVAWVFEAATLGISGRGMEDDCVEALRQGVILKNWQVMLEIVCATETLERWKDAEEFNTGVTRGHQAPPPTFLHTEMFVRPLVEWQTEHLRELGNDAELLLRGSETPRAKALLERWLKGLSVSDMCKHVGNLADPYHLPEEKSRSLGRSGQQAMEGLGAVCREAGVRIDNKTASNNLQREAQMYFERGWVQKSCELGPFDTLTSCFAGEGISYLQNAEAAVEILANGSRWATVREILSVLAKHSKDQTKGFKIQASWWALRSGATHDDDAWLNVLNEDRFGFSGDHQENISVPILVCRALAWKDTGSEPGSHARRVFDALQLPPDRASKLSHYKILFRAAATLERVQSVLHRRGESTAAGFLPIQELSQIAAALWGDQFEGFDGSQARQHARQLASELVNLAFQLGEAHVEALQKVGHPIADRCPVDHRLASIWLLYMRSGDLRRLQSWIQSWLGAEGLLWKEQAGSREETANKLLPLARELGEIDLANHAEERLSWLQITYRGHKEYSFNTPISWLTALGQTEPEAWRSLGVRLWRLSEACSALGGDDRCSFELGEILGAAAWKCGPDDVHRMLTTEYPDCGSYRWFYPTANRIINGLILGFSMGVKMAWRDAVSAWCVAVGLSRWFEDESVKKLTELRQALLKSADNEDDRRSIIAAIHYLTPSEAERIPDKHQNENDKTIKEEVIEDPDAWLQKTESNCSIQPSLSLQLLRHVLRTSPANFPQTAKQILKATCAGADYGWGWNIRDPLLEIAKIVSDDHLWIQVESILQFAGKSEHWMQGIYRSLHHVLLSRATKHGAVELQSGLQQIMAMHEKWAGLGPANLELPPITLGPSLPNMTWSDLATHALSFLLNSRSSEILESALVGVHALAQHDPDAVGAFLQLVDGNTWKQNWILNSAEAWAALLTTQLSKHRDILEKWAINAPLRTRLQIWIVLHRLARQTQTNLPLFPSSRSKVSAQSESLLAHPKKSFLETSDVMYGSVRFSDLYQSLKSKIRRIEKVTSATLSRIESMIAEKALHSNGDHDSEGEWPEKIACSGDTKCSPFTSDLLLDDALDSTLAENPLPVHLQPQFAQAYLDNENAWVLKSTPLPRSSWTNWPEENELRDSHDNVAVLPAIRRKLLLLASQDGIQPTEVVLAARVKVCSYMKDFIFRLWWEEGGNSGRKSDLCPTTLSGRTFVLDFENWWEPFREIGNRPLSFAVGGQQRLGLSFLEFMPARLWRKDFGWHPSQGNPLVWECEGEQVARYETVHGQLLFSHKGHWRQPLMGRWVVQRGAWEKVVHDHGPFCLRDDFQTFENPIE